MGAGVGTTGWGRPREGSRVDANNSMRYLCYGAFARGDARASGFGTREETRRRDVSAAARAAPRTRAESRSLRPGEEHGVGE